MQIASHWKDFELLDTGLGMKRERWGKYILERPDPQAIWPHEPWARPDARYIRSDRGGGNWDILGRLPQQWTVSYDSAAGRLTFVINPTGFKHTGLFPEQAVNWDLMSQKILQARAQGQTELRMLNLFAYTGAATCALAKAGASEIVHVDASKGMVAKAKDNIHLSGCDQAYVRFIVDDVQKFVRREIRRGRQYEGIILDPPAYGRGPSGELWQLADALYPLLDECRQLLSPSALFFIVNVYASNLAPGVINTLLQLTLGQEQRPGSIDCQELGLPAACRGIVLPCGVSGRWLAP
ncbi:MAG: class I SAM-dependent methyltransferase [Oscillospiraceae bacterium]|nr:class I SAM-dependent methyltransferase [Oscillospiraceae bacterium]MDD4368604.1 class I SAM-dependent methyltransferase [Oscillospiraceae bacterium]